MNEPRDLVQPLRPGKSPRTLGSAKRIKPSGEQERRTLR